MRVTVVYFACHTLDLACSLTSVLSPRRISELSCWLHSCLGAGGFSGSPAVPLAPGGPSHAHVACTYAAVCCLGILGADLSALPRASLSALLQSLQQPCGGVASSPACSQEVDVRFLYSAAALCQLLGLPVSWAAAAAAAGEEEGGGAALHGPAALRYLAACQTQEGGFSLCAGGGEAHGASTYCAIAAWALLAAGAPEGVAAAAAQQLDLPALRRWLALRQGGSSGVSGRAGKEGDACYTWWVGAAQRIAEGLAGGGLPLSAGAMAAGPPLLAWLDSCRGRGGCGFAKEPGAEADPFHTVFALAGMAVEGVEGLRAVDPVLGVTCRAAQAFVQAAAAAGSSST